MNILELYSGVGGMHMAFKESGLNGQIVAAVDINTVANAVYAHNFPNTLLLNRNIQSLTASFIKKLNVNCILMSPPCQPFTRNGLKRDTSDPRTCSFTYLLQQLPELDNIQFLLIENVRGFETSAMHQKLIETLDQCQFAYNEHLLCPTQIGLPNTRTRYYCLAKRKPLQFHHNIDSVLANNKTDAVPLAQIIETNSAGVSGYFLPDNILWKHAQLLDICRSDSTRSCCFTKAYGRYVEGTGSVFTPKSKQQIDQVYRQLEQCNKDDRQQCLAYIKELKLRFFTPMEVKRLMGFPTYFSFPHNITDNQKYRLLGNSINVKLVANLIRMLD